MVLFNLIPELIIFLGALTILMFDVFFGKNLKNKPLILLSGSFIVIIAALFVLISSYGINTNLFHKMFFVNKFISFSKIVILILLFLTLLISNKFLSLDKKFSAEAVSLMMIATSGSMFLISSNDLLPFYLALELQSLALYILAAMNRKSSKSSESGMKYFLLGSVSSGILLLGISFVYGFTGTTNFTDLFTIIEQYNNSQAEIFNIGLALGLILIFIAILFKISASPFHMWTPDVYEGAPTNITAFFASTIKFTMILVTIKIYFYIVNSMVGFNQILILIAILSLLTGCLGALKQKNIKRMLAYSGIGHVGFIIAGLAAANFEAIKAVILYAVIYASISIGSFAMLLLLVNKNKNSNIDEKNKETYDIESLAKISKNNPAIAFFLAILLFSMAGIPPMAGFFAKFYVLLSIVKEEIYYLAIIAVMTSVISAFYYLRIIKIMYFNEKISENITIEKNNNAGPLFALFLAAIFNLTFIGFIKPLLSIIANIFS